MKEIFDGYLLQPKTQQLSNGRFSVSVQISKSVNGSKRTEIFTDEKIFLILQVEAQKESLILGKNIIRRNMVSF